MTKWWIGTTLVALLAACSSESTSATGSASSSYTNTTTSSSSTGTGGTGGSAATGGESTSSSSGAGGATTGTGGTGGGTTGAGGGTAGGLPFGAMCMNNTDCSTGYCINFQTKGMHCTIPCTTNDMCIALDPNSKCGGMGYCSMP